MVFQEIIEQVESLSTEDQDRLFELIRKRRIENQEFEIATNLQEVSNVVEARTEEDTKSSEGFWDMTLRFREKMRQENITFSDEDFADLRDRSPGREVNL